MSHRVCCSDELTICNLGDFSNELLNAMQNSRSVTVDLAGVSRIDTAALQLLASARVEGERGDIRVEYILSEQVRSSAAAIGLSF